MPRVREGAGKVDSSSYFPCMRQSESVRRANVLWMKSGRISDESFGALSGFYKLGSARCQLQACRQTGRFASRELANATHCKVPTLSVKFPRLLSIHATAAAISTLSGSGPDRKSAHELLDLSSLSFGAAEFGLMRTGLMHGLHRLDQEARLMAVVRLCELAQERFFGCAGNIANGKHAEVNHAAPVSRFEGLGLRGGFRHTSSVLPDASGHAIFG